MIVYTVGINYESGIVGVYSSLEKAKEKVKESPIDFFIQVAEVDSGFPAEEIEE